MKRQKTLLWTVLLCLFFVASHASVFTDAFIRDDPTYILNNVDVTEGTPFCELLLRGFPPHSPLGLYRPLTTLSFQWDYWVGGGAPLPFHITNVILHILSAGMLFGCLVQALRLKTRRAGITAVLFTLLPVQSEVIHSITARSESLAFLLGVGAVWAFLARRRFLWAALAPLLLLCSVLSKESGVMWCAVVAVLLVCSQCQRTPNISHAVCQDKDVSLL